MSPEACLLAALVGSAVVACGMHLALMEHRYRRHGYKAIASPWWPVAWLIPFVLIYLPVCYWLNTIGKLP